VYYFPLWEKGVHDLLQKHFQTLSLIFLAYCRSVLGSSSAADAIEMEMAEFKDFVDECGLETKQISFELMSNMFIKANAINSAQVRDAHQEGRRSAATARPHPGAASAAASASASPSLSSAYAAARAARTPSGASSR
jgi:hypothetical protein